MTRRPASVALTLLATWLCAWPALAQSARRPVANRRGTAGWQVRPFADIGVEAFTANDSFRSIVGRPWGVVWGGGVEARPAGARWFVSGRISRFADTGHRVFVLDHTVFDLGLPTAVSITPIEASFGYRLRTPSARSRSRSTTYVAGGVGWHVYTEGPATPASDGVRKTFTGVQILAGLERPLARRLRGAGELQWSAVPRALGAEASSVGALFHERDLGGVDRKSTRLNSSH